METTKEIEEMYKALEEIRTRFGIDIINSPTKMKALLSDMVPVAKKETKLFFYVISNKGIINQIQNNKNISFEYVKKRIQEDEGLSDEWTYIMAQAIFLFFEYKINEQAFYKNNPIKNHKIKDNQIKNTPIKNTPIKNTHMEQQKKIYKQLCNIELVWREYLPKIQKKAFFPKLFFTPDIPGNMYEALERKSLLINEPDLLENPIGMLFNKRFGIISGVIVTYEEISIYVAGKYGKLRVRYDEIQDVKVTTKGNVSRLKILKKNGEIILFSPDSGIYEWFELANLEKALRLIVGI